MSNTKTLVDNLKRELKRQGFNYNDLAGKLGITESTVKKMFAKGNFSLDRLDDICDALKIDLLGLVENVNEEVVKISRLTFSQERQIVSDPKLLAIAHAATSFWPREDIMRRYEFTEDEILERLQVLVGFGLIELRANNHIRPLISKNFSWLPNGPLEHFFQEYVLPDFYRHDFKESGALRVLKNGDLSDASRKELERKCLELGELFEKLSYEDRHLQPGNRERSGTTMVVAYRAWTLSAFKEFGTDQQG